MLKCTADIWQMKHTVSILMYGSQVRISTAKRTADYMTNYQTRRLGTRVKRMPAKLSLRTNDATAFAIGRTIATNHENYQTADGNVRIQMY